MTIIDNEKNHERLGQIEELEIQYLEIKENFFSLSKDILTIKVQFINEFNNICIEYINFNTYYYKEFLENALFY